MDRSFKGQYLSIKIKKQIYLGRPSTAIYIRDITKKIIDTIEQIVHQEEKVKSQQSETFTATVSHEIRTPLNSTIFFLKQVITMLDAYENLPKDFVFDAHRLCSFMMSQLTFTMTFVEDLLDLKQIQEGIFLLQTAPFNPS